VGRRRTTIRKATWKERDRKIENTEDITMKDGSL